MITISSLAVILVLLFVFKKAIKHATKNVPDLALKAVITTDTALTASFNTVLLEVAETTADQAEKLGLDPSATPNDIFEQLTGVQLGQYGQKQQQSS